LPAKVFGEHGLWARLTGHVERWTRRGGRRWVRLVAGVDPNPEFGSNAMFYVRMECRQKGKKKVKVPGTWLSLSELTRLSIQMTLSTPFWFETLEKGKSSTSPRVREFQRAWNTVQDAIADLLPA